MWIGRAPLATSRRGEGMAPWSQDALLAGGLLPDALLRAGCRHLISGWCAPPRLPSPLPPLPPSPPLPQPGPALAVLSLFSLQLLCDGAGVTSRLGRRG